MSTTSEISTEDLKGDLAVRKDGCMHGGMPQSSGTQRSSTLVTLSSSVSPLSGFA